MGNERGNRMSARRRNQLIILLYFVAITVVGAYNFFLVVHQATDQNIFVNDPRGVRIIYIEKGGASDRAGLRVGDIITKINGKTFRNAHEADVLLQREYIGKEIEYEILRDGKPMTIHVRLATFGVQLYYLLSVLLGILFGLLGVFVGISRPHLYEARIFAITMITLNFALWLRTIPRPSQSSELFFKVEFFLNVVSLILATGLLFHLSFYFPARRFPSTIPVKKRLRVLYGVTGIYLGIIFLSLILNFHSPVFNLLFFAYLLLGFGLVHYRRSQIREEFRKKSRLMHYNNAILLLVTLLAFGLFFLVRHNIPFTTYLPYILLPLFASPILIFATIQRYRIFDLTIIIRKNWIYYTVSAFHTALTIVVLILLINRLPGIASYLPVVLFHGSSVEVFSLEQLPAHFRMQQEGILLGYGILLTLLILWIHRKTRHAIDRSFFQSQYDYRTALREFSPLGLIAPNESILARQVIENVDHIMHLKQVALAFREDGRFLIQAQKGFQFPEQLEFSDRLLTFLTRQPHSFLEITRSELPELASLSRYGALYLQCIRSKKQNLGFLLLGEKRSETAYNKEDLELLQIIATQVAIAIENIHLHREFSEKERLAHELSLAREIQLQSLPRPNPQLSHFDLYARLVPAKEVGGDYYDYFPISSHQLAVLIGDVAGKGMPAALYMSRIQGILKSLKHYHAQPIHLLSELNHILYQDLPKNSFFTLTYLLLDARKRRFTLARAGHNETLLYRNRTGKVETLQPSGMALGLDGGELFRRELKLKTGRFEPGDVFLLYTDGVTETFGERGEMFGEDNLVQLLIPHASGNARELVQQIERRLKQFRGNQERFDDATMIAIRALDGNAADAAGNVSG